MNDKNIVNFGKPIKICRVCGDVALGFNFQGLSCESCKAFFRRNITKEKDFECKNDNKCLVEKSTRKFCKRCRMDKCLAIGMKKELITVFKDKSKLGKIPESISEYNIELQPYDLMKIHEIEVAMGPFPDENKLPVVASSTDLLYLANMSEHYAKRIITCLKSIEAFRCLNAKDKLQLMKSFYPEMSTVHVSFMYVEEKDGVRIANETGQGTIFAHLELSEASIGFAKIFRKFAFPLRAIMDNDPTIRNLLFAQLLFKPRETTDCTEFLKYNYSTYIHLLRKYLRFKFKHAGDRKFVSLMAVLGRVEETSRFFRNLFENEFPPNELNEILRELYNIKLPS